MATDTAGDEQLRGSVGMGLPGGHHADDLQLHLGQRQPAGLLAALQAPPAQPDIERPQPRSRPPGIPDGPEVAAQIQRLTQRRPRAGGIPVS
jgi:hypothetical protein